MTDSRLPEQLLERVLARLGFSRRPDPTPETLRALYAAWCARVPFDNVRKLIHVRDGNAGRLPGSSPEDFFESWLKHGTGGTCWSGAGGCVSLLQTLGFDALRGIGTMLVAPGLPPNHGTVQVAFGPDRYLVDCSILHGEPLRLDENVETAIEHPAWGVRCRQRDGRLRLAWRPAHKVEGMECRLEHFGAKPEEFDSYHEKTRPWSPFNYELYVRLNRDQEVVGTGFGEAVTLHHDGTASSKPISDKERARLLIEVIGMSEEIVSQLPADVPTPPPPGSASALASSDSATL